MSIKKITLTSMAAFAFLISGYHSVKASPMLGATFSSFSPAPHSVLTEKSQNGQSLRLGQGGAKIIRVRGRNVGMRSSFNRRMLKRSRARGVHRSRAKAVRHTRRSVVVGTRGARYVARPGSYRVYSGPRIRREYIPRRTRGSTIFIYPRVYGARYKLRRCYHPQIRRYYYASNCLIVMKRVWFR